MKKITGSIAPIYLSVVFGLALVLAAAIETRAQKCDEESSIVSVKTTQTGRTESVVFRVLTGDPQFTIRTVRPPFYLGESDETIRVNGVAHRAIQFKGVMWMCVIDDGAIRPRLHIADVKNTYQFEGDVVYTVGLKRGVKYLGVTSKRSGKYFDVAFKFGK